ncbi:hypothetical protein G6F50_015112 [Rhizopus delemar]|uniref:Uncharacterized protein n=1 Tax=Rhizopus delemar TaxID=936053 RepID=A0A9P6XZX4_9FUNG|nr:hypothetical protein G6F50_015112 [Rhizopus delemar]
MRGRPGRDAGQRPALAGFRTWHLLSGQGQAVDQHAVVVVVGAVTGLALHAAVAGDEVVVVADQQQHVVRVLWVQSSPARASCGRSSRFSSSSLRAGTMPAFNVVSAASASTEVVPVS